MRRRRKMPLLEARKQYQPFEYPWAFDFWKRQQQIHWMPEEVPLGEDCRDWAQKLTDPERNLLPHIFRFFTQADIAEIGRATCRERVCQYCYTSEIAGELKK